MLKILRALQLDKGILLEGMPGLGKSSLIEYLASQVGRPLIKITLSE